MRAVDADYVQARLNNPKVAIVDARTDREQSVSRIPGAVTTEAFEAQLRGGAELDEVLCYCGIGGRSGGYLLKTFKSDGAEFAQHPCAATCANFELSLIDWCWQGYALESPDGTPTKAVHCFNGMFQSMYPTEGYELTTEP